MVSQLAVDCTVHVAAKGTGTGTWTVIAPDDGKLTTIGAPGWVTVTVLVTFVDPEVVETVNVAVR